MPLEKDTQLDELHYLRHKHDEFRHRHFPWENHLLKKTTSAFLWKNPVMNKFLTRIEKVLVLMVEVVAIPRNYFNYTVHKYNNDHWG